MTNFQLLIFQLLKALLWYKMDTVMVLSKTISDSKLTVENWENMNLLQNFINPRFKKNAAISYLLLLVPDLCNDKN